MKKRGPLKDAVVMFIILGTITAYVGAAGIPSASELIDKYTQALDSTSSFIADYEKTTEGRWGSSRGSNTSKKFSRGQLRYDNQQVYVYEYRWGDWASLTFTEDKPHYTIGVVNSEMNYQNTKRVGDRPGKVIRTPRPRGQNITLEAHFGVSYLAGYIGSDERLDTILRKADNVSVRGKTEKVGDSECFVLEADTKYGQYAIWLDPEHGFHPAQVLHKGGEGDYSGRHLMAKGDTAKEYLKNVRFEKVGDVWVPMEADSGSDLRSARGDFNKDNYHYKRTKIVLNPDHNKLGSFDDPLENPSNDPELTNGTRVLKDHLPIEYIWQDGELIPDIDEAVIDEIDKMTEEIMAGPTAQELLDKFTESVDKTHTSFITKSKTVMILDNKYDGKWAYLNGEKTKYILQEFRTDGRRMKRIRRMWGEFAAPDRNIFRPESEKSYVSEIYNGDERYQYARPHDSAGSVIIELKGPPKTFTIDKKLAYGNNVSECFGYLEGDVERFDRILKKAGTRRVSVRDQMEDLNGTAHYVIDAKTRNGQYTIWLNPEKGYNLSKAVVVREPGDLYMGRHKVKPGCQKRYIIENTQFTDVNGVWVPAKAKMRIHDTHPRGNRVKHTKDVELTSILVDPDHDALDSFSIDDIKDGARVIFKYGPPGKFVWRDGKAVADVDKLVISELDKMAKEIMAEKAGTQEPRIDIKPPSESRIDLANLTVSELLKKYRATQDKLQSFIAKGESLIEYVNKTRQSSRKENENCEFRFDGNRVYHRSSVWDKLLSKDKALYKSFLWDGKSFIEYKQGLQPRNNTVFIEKNDDSKKRLIATEYKGAPLMGICAGDYDRIDSILRKADNISLQQKTEQVGGSQCYVIDAVTKRGKYKVWIDPEHGYNIAKIEVQKRKGDLIRHSGRVRKDMSFSLRNVRFAKIDGVWVPMEADMKQNKNNRTRTIKWHHKRTQMTVNPDHDALASFLPGDIPDGTKVNIVGSYSKYIWQNGGPVAEVD